MKRVILTLILSLVVGVFYAPAKEKATKALEYEIKCAGTGQQGYYLLEVTVYVDSKSDVNLDAIKKGAVHGVLFKGIAGGDGCKAQKPMISPTEEQHHADYFNSFFNNEYKDYVTCVDSSMRTVKVGKRYAVTATVQVAKDSLRDTMQKAGILRKLGF